LPAIDVRELATSIGERDAYRSGHLSPAADIDVLTANRPKGLHRL